MKMKLIVTVLVFILSISLVSGAVTVSVGGDSPPGVEKLIYSSSEAGGLGGATNMYWAVSHPIPVGCSGLTITDCTAISGEPCENFPVWVDLVGNELRVVSATNIDATLIDASLYIAPSVEVSLEGTGTCNINAYEYAESTEGGNVATTPQSGSWPAVLDFGGGCTGGGPNTLADNNPCDGNVCNPELLAYMGIWLTTHTDGDAGTDDAKVDNTKLLGAMGAWLSTHGGCS